MQTPVSPASPIEPDKMLKPKPLRKEARDMLTDLAMRKQSPGNSLHMGGSTNSPGTPRRRRLQKTPSPDIKSVVADSEYCNSMGKENLSYLSIYIPI